MLTVMHVVCVCVVYVVIKCNVALSVYKKTTFLCVFFFVKMSMCMRVCMCM